MAGYGGSFDGGRCSERLIVIVSAWGLSEISGRELNAGLSWEETIDGLLRKIQQGGTLAGLTRCRHLIVAFESESALWLDMPGDILMPAPASFIDPEPWRGW